MENNHNQQKMFSSGLPQIDHGSKFMDFFFGTASYNIWRWGTFLGLRGHNLDMFPIGIHQRESMLKTGFIFGRPFEQLFKNSSTWQGSPPRNSVAKVICDGEASTYCLLASSIRSLGAHNHAFRVYCSSGTFQNLGGVPNGLHFFLRTPFNQFFKFFIWFLH